MKSEEKDLRSGSGGSNGALSAIYGFGSRASGQASQLIMLGMSVVYLSPAELGVYTLSSAITMLVQAITYCGMPDYLVRNSTNKSRDSSVFWLMMFISVGLCVVIAAAAPVFDQIFKTDQLSGVLVLLLCAQPLMAVSAWCAALHMRNDNSEFVFKILLIENLIGLIVGVVAMQVMQSIYALVVFRCFTALVGASLMFATAKAAPHFVLKLNYVKDAIAFTSGLYGARVITYLCNYGVEFIVGIALSVADAGLYRLASRLAVIVSDVIFQPTRTYAVTRLSSNLRNGIAMEGTYIRFLVTTTCLCSISSMALVAVSYPGINILLDPVWHRVVPVAALLCIAKCFSVNDFLLDPFLSVQGRGKELLGYKFKMLFLLLSMALITSIFGMVEIAAGQLAVMLVSNNMVVGLVARELNSAKIDIIRKMAVGYLPCLSLVVLAPLLILQDAYIKAGSLLFLVMFVFLTGVISLLAIVLASKFGLITLELFRGSAD